MNLNDMIDAQFIALETFRKNGEGVITPVWITDEAGKLYVWTGASSGKVKRIRNNARVRLCKSDGSGHPQSEWIEAQALILDTPAAKTAAERRLSAKYGITFRLITLMQRFIRFMMRREANSVVIELT